MYYKIIHDCVVAVEDEVDDHIDSDDGEEVNSFTFLASKHSLQHGG